MTFTFSGERQVDRYPCRCCDSVVDRSSAKLDRDGSARALFSACCYHHGDGGEVWFDIAIGTWGTDDHSDHVAFGCRWGAVDGRADPMCSLTTGAGVLGDSPVWGTKLDRPAALRHPLLPEFWAMVDFLLESDPVVHPFISSHRPRPR